MNRPLPLSYSRADLFESCAYRFKAQVLEKVPEPRSRPLGIGSLLHALTERYGAHLVETKQRTDHARFDGMYEEMWSGRAAEKDYSNLLEADRPEVDELAATLRTSLALEPEKVVGVELRVAVDADWKPVDWFADDVFVRGIIDRLECSAEGQLLVWDLKTGHGLEADPMQQDLYGPLARAHVPEAQEVVGVELHQLRHGVTTRREVDGAGQARAQRWIEAVSARVERARSSDTWPATPGPRCSTCPVFDRCPARREALAHRSAATVGQAQAILRRLVLLDAERETLRQAVRGWVETQGPLRDGMTVALLKTIRKKEYPIGKLLPLLEAAKVLDRNAFLKADNTQVEKLAKKDKAFGAAVDAIRVEKPYQQLEVEEAEREEK